MVSSDFCWAFLSFSRFKHVHNARWRIINKIAKSRNYPHRLWLKWQILHISLFLESSWVILLDKQSRENIDLYEAYEDINQIFFCVSHEYNCGTSFLKLLLKSHYWKIDFTDIIWLKHVCWKVVHLLQINFLL